MTEYERGFDECKQRILKLTRGPVKLTVGGYTRHLDDVEWLELLIADWRPEPPVFDVSNLSDQEREDLAAALARPGAISEAPK